MSRDWSGSPLVEMLKKERATGSSLTADEARISGLIGSYLNYEHIEIHIEEWYPNGSPLHVRLQEYRLEIETHLSPWLARSDNSTIALVYFVADSHLFERVPSLGYKFAVYLCNELGAERVLEIVEELHECPERERLETIAAELSERGGG